MLCFRFGVPMFRACFRAVTSLGVFRESAKPEAQHCVETIATDFGVLYKRSQKQKAENGGIASIGSGLCLSARQLFLRVVKTSPLSSSSHQSMRFHS